MLANNATLTRNNLCLELKEKLQALIISGNAKSSLGTELNFCAQLTPSKKQSLFNQFFSEIYLQILKDDSVLLREEMQFIQNVPRMDFYREVLHDDLNFKLGLVQKIFKTGLTKILSTPLKEKEDCNFLFNVFNICLRIGVDRSFLAQCSADIENDNFRLRFHLLKNISRISHEISDNEQISKASLYETLRLSDSENVSPLMYCSIVNRLVVSFSRYGDHEDNELEQEIFQRVNKARSLLQKITVNTNMELISLSMIYRGLPMAKNFTIEDRRAYLYKSSIIADKLGVMTNVEQIIKDEFCFTLNLTRFKFELHTGNRNKADIHLKACLDLDPNNSAIYTELGLLNIKDENYSTAIESFQRASDLGAPNLSMNHFFLGESLRKLEKIEEARQAYLDSIKFDDKAVSPILSLIEIGTENNRELINILRATPELYEQLTDTEKCVLKI